MAEDPSKLTPLMVFPAANLVAVPALPVRDPDIGFVTVRFVKVPTLVKLLVTTELFRVVPVRVPAADVIVIAELPSKFTPLMVFPAANFVAVAALPVILPVRFPANPVAVKIPVEGIKLSFVSDNLAALFPEAVVHRG